MSDELREIGACVVILLSGFIFGFSWGWIANDNKWNRLIRSPLATFEEVEIEELRIAVEKWKEQQSLPEPPKETT